MIPFDNHLLGEFYSRISSEAGISVVDFQTDLKSLFERPRSTADLKDYRLGRSRWKKLADEVSPVSRFLRFQRVESGRIRFPLDSNVPDCWLWNDNCDNRIGLEVTVALGTARYHLAKELVDTGLGRGFIGLPDDAPRPDFDRAIARKRVMFSTNQALSAVQAGILRCLGRKNDPKFAGFVLLIQAPLISLPHERWDAIRGDLSTCARTLPFHEVHVIGNAEEAPWGFQIK